MSRLDPQPGETFIHPTFGQGCEVRILKRGTRNGWGDAVWFELRPLTWESIRKPRRISRMTTWPEFAAGFVDAAPTHQEKP